MNPALQNIVAQVVAPLGFDVVDLRQRGSRQRPILEVRIAHQDGAAITVDDCAQVSRAIEAQFDTDKSLGDFYTLEVSSPGIRDDADINWKR